MIEAPEVWSTCRKLALDWNLPEDCLLDLPTKMNNCSPVVLKGRSFALTHNKMLVHDLLLGQDEATCCLDVPWVKSQPRKKIQTCVCMLWLITDTFASFPAMLVLCPIVRKL